jgi:hypothetical protein
VLCDVTTLHFEQARDIVVVADAGMLSAANLLALEDNGFRSIVGSRTGKIPYELEAHVERHGNYLADGATIETTRRMGTGRRRGTGECLPLRVQTRPARQSRDQRHGRTRRKGRPRRTPAEEGRLRHLHRHLHQRGLGPGRTRPVPDRDQGLRHQHRRRRDERPAVVAAYHDLYQVERSFRMTKSDLAARPMFHRLEDSIQAHLTIVFAALAVSREAQARAGLSINKILKTLRPLRSATITIGA